MPDRGRPTYWRTCACGRRMSACATRCIECRRQAERPTPEQTAARFWSKVRKGDGCWEWQAKRFDNGYGSFAVSRNKNQGAHRVAWELTNGPIPAGMSVLHHCDNRPCVRPDHLFLGTQLDNMRDMLAKGRQRWRGQAAA